MITRIWLTVVGVLFALFTLLCLQTPTQATHLGSLSNAAYPYSGEIPFSGAKADAPQGATATPPPNIDVISNEPPTYYPRVHQEEAMVGVYGTVIVVNYNDQLRRSDPPPTYCVSGLSYSIDGGSNFTRILPNPLCDGHGANRGDPMVVWNGHPNRNAWYVIELAEGCSSNPGLTGLGMWTSANGSTWTAVTPCAQSGNIYYDRQSLWVDNNCDSKYWGYMYLSWVNQGDPINFPIYVSSLAPDPSATWTPRYQLASGSEWRHAQTIGSSGSDGTVFVTGRRVFGASGTNYLFRSTDGGEHWTTAKQIGTSFPIISSVFPNWRDNEGHPAVGPDGVVHYVYGSAATAYGDIYYVRSTDNGDTWSTPLRMNQDTTNRPRWMPSVAATRLGAIVVGWYDRRATTNYDYEYWGRISTDNGATWGDEFQISSQLIPQPATPNPYAGQGDYYYPAADDNAAYFVWADGRIQLPSPTGTPQSDIFFAKLPAASSVCAIQFVDVKYGEWYYPYIRCLACQGIISGYDCVSNGDANPCTCSGNPYFNPNNKSTRGQVAKIISEAAGYTDAIPGTQQTFEDVPNTNAFWLWIERLYIHNVISGYPCGGAGEPCGPGSRPYFRWGAEVTRSQMAKMVAIAVPFNDVIPSTQQTFEDVPNTNAFWLWIERLYIHNVISGYPCGGAGEPCGPGNRPYFRWSNSVTRAQTAKIVRNSFFPTCEPVPVDTGSSGDDRPGAKPPPPARSDEPATPPAPTGTISLPTPVPTIPLPTPVPTGSALPSPVPTGPAPTAMHP